jgi:hypothetical protein
MIVALAGRRVDALGAQPRFPLQKIEIVRDRIHSALQEQKSIALVSSAACGADLLALLEAGRLGLRRRIVLPFDRAKFRKTSVIDRPGNWGSIYDRVLDEVEAKGEVMIIQPQSEETAYVDATYKILDEALRLSRDHHCSATAMVVWDGKSRGHRDLTEEFKVHAERQNIPVVQVLTL